MLMADIVGRRVRIRTDQKRIRPDKSEVERLCCDARKLRAHTDWTPKYSLQEGIQETANWIEKNIERFKSDRYNV